MQDEHNYISEKLKKAKADAKQMEEDLAAQDANYRKLATVTAAACAATSAAQNNIRRYYLCPSSQPSDISCQLHQLLRLSLQMLF